MIPLFPKFKKLELKDKSFIEKLTKAFPPYSDYNFVSLWSYSVRDKNEVSILNKNLVIKLRDYQTLEPFYSFLGNNRVKKTIDTLLEYAKNKGITQELRLIPEISIKGKKEIKNTYYLKEDRDNFDYVLSVDNLIKLKGNGLGPKRNFINRFVKNYTDSKVIALDLKKSKVKQEIKNLFYEWEKQRKKSRKETKNELTALNRLLKSSIIAKIICVGVYIDKTLVGFSINELAQNQYSFLHFEKANIAYTGIFQYLKQVTALHLKKKGCNYINYEQDLGIPGLRKSKESWRPVKYLKKYVISPKK